MTVETSTANILLSAIIALLVWIIREMFKLKNKVSTILILCKKCRHNVYNTESDTDRIVKAAT